MKGLAKVVGLLCVIACVFGGCGQTVKIPEVITENTVIVAENGEITEYLIDDFEKDYYSVEGLTSMVDEEAKAYNSDHVSGEGQPVTVGKVEKTADGTGRVLVNRSYASDKFFRDFTGNTLHYGTVTTLKDVLEKMDSTMTFTGVKKQDTVSLFQVLAMGEKHVIVTDMSAFVFCPYNIEYISQGLTIKEDGSVDTSTASNSTVVIVLKK